MTRCLVKKIKLRDHFTSWIAVMHLWFLFISCLLRLLCTWFSVNCIQQQPWKTMRRMSRVFKKEVATPDTVTCVGFTGTVLTMWVEFYHSFCVSIYARRCFATIGCLWCVIFGIKHKLCILPCKLWCYSGSWASPVCWARRLGARELCTVVSRSLWRGRW